MIMKEIQALEVLVFQDFNACLYSYLLCLRCTTEHTKQAKENVFLHNHYWIVFFITYRLSLYHSSFFLPKLGSILMNAHTPMVAAQQIMVHTKKWR